MDGVDSTKCWCPRRQALPLIGYPTRQAQMVLVNAELAVKRGDIQAPPRPPPATPRPAPCFSPGLHPPPPPSDFCVAALFTF